MNIPFIALNSKSVITLIVLGTDIQLRKRRRRRKQVKREKTEKPASAEEGGRREEL